MTSLKGECGSTVEGNEIASNRQHVKRAREKGRMEERGGKKEWNFEE